MNKPRIGFNLNVTPEKITQKNSNNTISNYKNTIIASIENNLILGLLLFVITVIVILFLDKWKEFVDTTTRKKYIYSFNYLNKDIQIIPPISYLDTGSKQLNISGICDINKNMKIDPEDKECEYHNIQQYQVIKTTRE